MSLRWLIVGSLVLAVAGCAGNDGAELTSPAGAPVRSAQIALTPAPQGTPVLSKYEVPFPIASDGMRVVAGTSQGYLVTENAGRTWHRLAPVLTPRDDGYGNRPAFDVGAAMTVSSVIDPAGTCERVTVRRLGRPAQVARAPGCVGQLAITGDHRAFLLTSDFNEAGYQPPKPFYVSDDDAKTWKRRSWLPKGLLHPNALAADGDLVVSLWAADRPLVVSRDGGATWKQVAVPGDDCLSADVSGREIWIACGRRVHRSPDAGQSWHAWNLPDVDPRGSPATAGLIVDSIVALGSRRAMLSTHGTSVLVTSDGGAHWRQRWPVLARG